MKKILRTIIITIVLFTFFTLTAYADIGSKPKVTIDIKNPPEENYYLDLLYKKENNSDKYTLYKNLDDDSEYNQEMLSLLFSYENENLIPAMAAGTFVPTFGDIVSNENKFVFSYLGVPDEFKIIIVTENGTVKTSDWVNRKTMEISLELDYETMDFKTQSFYSAILSQFVFNCCITLLVEFLILLIFKYNIKNNIKIFTYVNIFTQIIFNIAFSYLFMYYGTFSVVATFIPMEIAITTFETYIYCKKLKGQSTQKNIIYGITANITSATLTYFSLDMIFDFMFKLIR